MKKTLVLILALPLCIAFIMSVFAKSKPTRMIFTGEVAHVDEMAQTISVKAAKIIEVFDIADAILNEGSDLRPGDVVEIEYEEREGTRKAIAILLKTGTGAPETPPPAMEEPAEEPAPFGSPEQSL